MPQTQATVSVSVTAFPLPLPLGLILAAFGQPAASGTCGNRGHGSVGRCGPDFVCHTSCSVLSMSQKNSHLQKFLRRSELLWDSAAASERVCWFPEPKVRAMCPTEIRPVWI